MWSSLLASAPSSTLSMIAESTGPVAILEMTVDRTPKASWKARASE